MSLSFFLILLSTDNLKASYKQGADEDIPPPSKLVRSPAIPSFPEVQRPVGTGRKPAPLVKQDSVLERQRSTRDLWGSLKGGGGGKDEGEEIQEVDLYSSDDEPEPGIQRRPPQDLDQAQQAGEERSSCRSCRVCGSDGCIIL